MGFWKKRDESEGAGDPADAAVEAVPEEHRYSHKGYTIIPVVKRLHNGRWVVRVVLEESGAESRRYDYGGPMKEYTTEELARQGGVDFAVKRLGERVTSSDADEPSPDRP